MKKFKKSMVTCATTLVLGLGFSSGNLLASEGDVNVPSSIKKQIEQDREDISLDQEIKAWEVDLNGNRKEVNPISQSKKYPNYSEFKKALQVEGSKDAISIEAVPNDGYVYVADGYEVDRTNKIFEYDETGVYEAENTTPIKQTFTYVQSSNETTNWTVNGSISGSTTIGNSFLGKVEVEASVGVSRSKTWSGGTQYGSPVDVPGNTTYWLVNWAGAVDTDGAARYKKYSPSGTSLLGYYYESAGGYAVADNIRKTGIYTYNPL